jgi:F-type H+-transporting ATPase subunit gamma
MQSLRDIKRRMRSVKNIAQITKAMEVVSMTKMRRSQMFALAARPYALASLDMLQNLLAMTPENKLPALLSTRPIKNSLLL